MKIEPFGVEIWMNEFENDCELNLAETCVHSISVGELLELCGCEDEALTDLLPMRLGYGSIPGSDRLRDAITALYRDQARSNVLVTHGTIGANSLVHQSLLCPGDHVVSLVPTYQQHYSIPESIGARVTPLRLRAEDHWLPDLDQLKTLVREDTKLIAMTNPNNPTGSLMDLSVLNSIADIAREAHAWVLCDEVYRGTNQEDPGSGPSIVDIYERGISTAGMSKAFSLAGLRLGWIAGPEDIIENAMIHRDYNTISVGVIDEHFAALALENSERLLQRSRKITRDNLKIVSDWVDGEPCLSWVPPKAGTTGLLRYELDVASRDLCLNLLKETGVMFTPGAAMGMEGYLRIGFANPTETLREGLGRVSRFFKSPSQ